MNTQAVAAASTLALLSSFVGIGAAYAHGAESHDVELHTGNAYDDCYFDLHPELTESEFRQFAAEAGQVIYFRPLASADTLGTLTFDVSLGAASTAIDDSKGAWNNTMSHPESDHYLGTSLVIPQLTLRAGVTDDIDVEAYATINPTSNYGFVGAATKLRFMNFRDGYPVSLSLRPHLSALIGPAETSVATGGADVLVSREFYGLAPFAGLGVNTSVAVDNSEDTDVDHQGAVRPIVQAGLDYNWKMLSVGASVEHSALTTYGVRLGARF